MGESGSVPGLGRSPGEGNGNPLQYSCLENPMEGGAWWATVHGVSKSQTRLSHFTSLDSEGLCLNLKDTQFEVRRGKYRQLSKKQIYLYQLICWWICKFQLFLKHIYTICIRLFWIRGSYTHFPNILIIRPVLPAHACSVMSTLCDPWIATHQAALSIGIFQVRILDVSWVSCIGRQILYHWATWEVQYSNQLM